MSARSVCCRGSAVRLPPVSSRNMSSRRSLSFSTGSAFTRAAASSMASGIPSNRSQTCATDGPCRLLPHPQRGGNRLRHQGGISERCQLRQPHAVRILLQQVGGHLQREARLAAAAAARQREQSSSGEKLLYLGHRLFPPDEAG